MCVRVDIGVHKCACVAICVQVWAFVCRGGHECALRCAAVGIWVQGWAWVGIGVHECAGVGICVQGSGGIGVRQWYTGVQV